MAPTTQAYNSISDSDWLITYKSREILMGKLGKSWTGKPGWRAKMHTGNKKVKGVWHLRLGRKGSNDEVSKSNQADGEIAQ